MGWDFPLIVQWLGLRLPVRWVRAQSLVGLAREILCALRPKNQSIKQKQHCNKFKHFKNGAHQIYIYILKN